MKEILQIKKSGWSLELFERQTYLPVYLSISLILLFSNCLSPSPFLSLSLSISLSLSLSISYSIYIHVCMHIYISIYQLPFNRSQCCFHLAPAYTKGVGLEQMNLGGALNHLRSLHQLKFLQNIVYFLCFLVLKHFLLSDLSALVVTPW